MLLNADLGESWYDHVVGDDAGLMPYLDRCNIACGFHGGDALTMQRTVELALHHTVGVGAHPSYPDRRNFGRRSWEVSADRLEAMLTYQIGALAAMVRVAGGTLTHLKPHGALYHDAASGKRPEVTRAVITASKRFGGLPVMGPPQSALADAAAHSGIAFLAEGFADRAYGEDGSLVPRGKAGATIDTADECRDQVRNLLAGTVRTITGRIIALKVDTICLHGDHPGAADRAAVLRELLDRH